MTNYKNSTVSPKELYTQIDNVSTGDKIRLSINGVDTDCIVIDTYPKIKLIDANEFENIGYENASVYYDTDIDYLNNEVCIKERSSYIVDAFGKVEKRLDYYTINQMLIDIQKRMPSKEYNSFMTQYKTWFNTSKRRQRQKTSFDGCLRFVDKVIIVNKFVNTHFTIGNIILTNPIRLNDLYDMFVVYCENEGIGIIGQRAFTKTFEFLYEDKLGIVRKKNAPSFAYFGLKRIKQKKG